MVEQLALDKDGHGHCNSTYLVLHCTARGMGVEILCRLGEAKIGADSPVLLLSGTRPAWHNVLVGAIVLDRDLWPWRLVGWLGNKV